MRNILYTKGLVFGIIFLFVGAGVVPTISIGFTEENLNNQQQSIYYTNNPKSLGDSHDLVIIAPNIFSDELQKLIEHKNQHGINTYLKTTESIYNEYDGVDKPEQIKYFIKYAIENWSTRYVLLVGGLKSLIYGRPKDDPNQGAKDWWLPVRYSNLKEDGFVYDPGFISDLYYVDIYDAGGGFSSWDSNGDGYFANWGNIPGAERDIIDFYPDVAVGRLPCRNKLEVRIMVNKIIKYEKKPGGSWYDKMICVAGDSYDDPPWDLPEGEIFCDLILERYMDEFTPVRLYGSNTDTDPSMTPEPKNIIREISKGSGHLLFIGAGNPYKWSTHYPGDFQTYAGGIDILRFPLLINGGKLPICVTDGCHNSMFNVSAVTTWLDKDNSKHLWSYGRIVPECWSWWLTRKIGGGCIATLGNTGLTYLAMGDYKFDPDGDGVDDPDCFEVFYGFLMRLFYEKLDEGVGILGDAWADAMVNYMDIFPPMFNQIDAKTVQQWVLIGDPSLKIGGY